MPSPPEHRMQGWLKGYAQQRRQQMGPPPELHPVTRRLLQAEAQNLYGPDKIKSRPLRRLAWFTLWPRLALAAALLAFLGLVALLVLPNRDHPMKMVSLQQELEPTPSEVVRDEASPSPDESPTDSRKEKSSPELSLALRSVPAPATPASEPAREVQPPPPSPLQLADPMPRLEDQSSPSRRMAQIGEALRPIETWTLNQVPPQPSAPFLSRFDVQLAAQVIWLRDRDGSVYTGTWTPLAAPTGALATSNTSTPPSFAFSVQGTNLTLQQGISFQGRATQIQTNAGPVQWSFQGVVHWGETNQINLRAQTEAPVDR